MKRLIALLALLGGALAYVRRRRGSEGQAGYGETSKWHEGPARPDDATLVDKIRSEIFRDVDVPKGQININVEKGKVVLRGEVDQPELIEQLVERTRNVHGVEDVENLLHVGSRPDQG
jgi:osmotically-inducible protein OsmY